MTWPNTFPRHFRPATPAANTLPAILHYRATGIILAGTRATAINDIATDQIAAVLQNGTQVSATDSRRFRYLAYLADSTRCWKIGFACGGQSGMIWPGAAAYQRFARIPFLLQALAMMSLDYWCTRREYDQRKFQLEFHFKSRKIEFLTAMQWFFLTAMQWFAVNVTAPLD